MMWIKLLLLICVIAVVGAQKGYKQPPRKAAPSANNPQLSPPRKGGASAVKPRIRPPVREEPIQPQVEEEAEYQVPDEPPRKGAGSDSGPAFERPATQRPLPASRPKPQPAPAPRRPATKGYDPDRDAADSGDDATRTGHAAPEPYQFSFSAEADQGVVSTREESQDASGRVVGFYMIKAADGTERRVDYTADENGFRASVKSNEEGVSVGRSGADTQFEKLGSASERVSRVASPAKLAANRRQQPKFRQ